MRRSPSWLWALAVLTLPSGASAQSLFATRGLGVPVAPVDARARALGGIGVGLLGLNTSLVNPAEVAGLGRRGVSAALQPVEGTASLGDAEDDVDGTRFPMLRLLLPLQQRVVLSLGYGGALEQSWAVRTEGFERVGADSIGTVDVVESRGGVTRVTAGVAYTVAPTLAVGVAAGLHSGSLQRRVSRTFTDSLAGLQPFETQLEWDYGGPLATAGIRWDPLPIVRVGASFTWSGDLDIEGERGLVEDGRSEMPMQLAFGASGLLSPELLLSLGAERSWGAAAAVDLDGSAAARRDTWRWGGGLEYGGIQSGARSFPVRLGGSYAQLPYFNVGEEPATEWSAAFGLGFRLAGDEAGPLAVLDATFERGGRSGLESTVNVGGLSESFWRFSITLALFGR